MIRLNVPTVLDADLPSYVHPTLRNLTATLDLVDDLREGPIAMWREAATRGYIHKWTDEAQATYDYRSRCEPVFMGLDRTVQAGASMLWADEPRMSWGPHETDLTPLWDNIDACGTRGTVFGKRFSERVMEHGLAVILVDHTAPPEGERVTALSERRYNLRPVWRMYARRNVLNWASAIVDNVPRLTRLTLRELSDKTVGVYGTQTAVRYRVLEVINGVAGWTVYEVHTVNDPVAPTGERNQVILHSAGVFRDRTGAPRSTLPVAVAGIGGTDVATALDANVPLRGVAFANLAHWRASTNLTFNRELCGFEMLHVDGQLMRGPDDDVGSATRIKVGPAIALHTEQGGSVRWIAATGAGNAQLERACVEKMEQMDKQGLGFLVPHMRASATATEVNVTARTQFATLTDVGIAVADAINYAWELTGWYLGIARTDVPVMQLRTDYANTEMQPDVMRTYIQLTEAGFPRRVVLRALQEGKRIGPDEDLDELAAEWEGEAQADRMAREEEARARALEFGGGSRNNTDENTNDDTDDDTDDNTDDAA